MYHTFSRDSLLLPHEQTAIRDPSEGYNNIEQGLHVVAEVWNVPVGEPTKERWWRMLHWSRAMDILLDESDVAYPLTHYADLTASMLAEPWAPAAETTDATPDGCMWARITRSSFEDGDVSKARRARANRQ